MCSRRGNALLTDQLVVGPDRRGGEHTQRIPPPERLYIHEVPTYILIPTNRNIGHNIIYIIIIPPNAPQTQIPNDRMGKNTSVCL